MRTYRIGAFARFTQTPVKTLRHYDTVGLLRPAHVDRRTQYRYYTAAQVERLNRILALKDLGCSLREIRELLADRAPVAQIAAMLEAKHAALARHVAAESARLARAAARIALLARDGHEVAIRTTAPQLVASLRATLPDHADCDQLFAELPAGGERAAIWHACEPRAIDCEALVFLAAPVSGARVHELPAQRVASLVYRGDDDYLPAYRAIRAWLGASGMAIAGPKREVFLADALTEIQFPIREAA